MSRGVAWSTRSEQEHLMPLPKVRFAHRATYKGITLLLGQLMAAASLLVTATFIPFTFPPFNTRFTHQIEHWETFNATMDDAKNRILIVFLVPVIGGSGVALMTTIFLLNVYKKGGRLGRMTISSVASLLVSVAVTVYCGIISRDLGQFPSDSFGLADPLAETYSFLLQDYIVKNSSAKETDEFHSIHKCCGLTGVTDFFLDGSFLFFQGPQELVFDWPSPYNDTHMETAPPTCCRELTDGCNRQASGERINIDRFYTSGCLEAVRMPLQAQSEWMMIVSFLCSFSVILCFVLMFFEVRSYKKLRTKVEAKRSSATVIHPSE